MRKKIVGLTGLSGLLVSMFPLPLLAETNCSPTSPNDHVIRFCGNTHQLPPQEKISQKNSYTIPIKRRISGVPVVEVILDGHHRVEMLFDTGASLISIHPEVASNVEIATTKDNKKTYAATGAIESQVGVVPTMQAGDLAYRNIKILITPNLSVPGILGTTFFADYDITIRKDSISLTHNPDAYKD